MELGEIRRLKQELENEFSWRLSDFKSSSGVAVEKVRAVKDFETVDHEGWAESKLIWRVALELEEI